MAIFVLNKVLEFIKDRANFIMPNGIVYQKCFKNAVFLTSVNKLVYPDIFCTKRFVCGGGGRGDGRFVVHGT